MVETTADRLCDTARRGDVYTMMLEHDKDLARHKELQMKGSRCTLGIQILTEEEAAERRQKLGEKSKVRFRLSAKYIFVLLLRPFLVFFVYL